MFADRKDGAEKLGKVLSNYRFEHPLVLGIARGGIVTAYYVANYLNADFSFVITRKLGYPLHPEVAFGAITEDGNYFIFEDAIKSLSPKVIQELVTSKKQEIKRRIQKLRKGRPLPAMQDRNVIIVDDGIATGATMLATIALCRNHLAKKIVVATPVAGTRMEKTLLQKADDVMILYTPPFFQAVSQGYQSFNDVTDKEVMELINTGEKQALIS